MFNRITIHNKPNKHFLKLKRISFLPFICVVFEHFVYALTTTTSISRRDCRELMGKNGSNTDVFNSILS